MKIKTSELTGAALDWAVGTILGEMFAFPGSLPSYWEDGKLHTSYSNGRMYSPEGYSPSTSWAQGGPLVSKLVYFVEEQGPDCWAAMCGGEDAYGPTPLIAICRAVVACKLGEEVEVPDELAGGV